MSYTIAGVYRPDLGSAADGLTVKAFPVNGWTGNNPPHLNDSPPGSGSIGTGSTSSNNGNYGAWEISLTSNEDVFVVVEDSPNYYWERVNAAAWVDGSSPTELDVGTLVAAAPITVDSVTFAGMNTDSGGIYTKTIGTANNGSAGAGASNLAAYIDHVHAGLGQPIGETGATAGTQYIGGTTGGIAPSGGSYNAGDFAIDQTGIVWIYNGTTWVEIAPPSAFDGVTGDIKAWSGISTPPTGWLTCDGTSYSETAYSALFAAVTLTGATFTGTTNGTTSITNIPLTFADQLQPGWFIAGEDGDIAAGTYIVSITLGATGTVVLSAATSGSGYANEVLGASPYGISYTSPDWSFNVPDLRGRVVVGVSSLGTNSQPTVWLGGTSWKVGATTDSGETQHTLASPAELPSHAHSHQHGGSTDGAYTGYETAYHYHDYSQTTGPGASGEGGWGYIGDQLAGTGNESQPHQHYVGGLTIPPDATDYGNSGAHNNMQPFAGINYLIKT